MKIIRTVLVFLLLLIPLPLLAGWFGPSNYEECILESMKGVTSDKAAAFIERSCRQKFPKEPVKKPKSRPLSNVELINLTGRAGLGPADVGLGSYFSGNIYNGNLSVTVSEITIWVTTTVANNEVTRTYANEVTIEPQTTGNFGFNIIVGDKGAGYSWGITGAKGY